MYNWPLDNFFSAKETLVWDWPCIEIILNANRGREKQLFSQYSKFFWEICAEGSNKCISKHWHTDNYCEAKEHLHARGIKTTLQLIKRKIKSNTSMRNGRKKKSFFSWKDPILLKNLIVTHFRCLVICAFFDWNSLCFIE